MDDQIRIQEPNKFRDICRSIEEAGHQCLEEIIAADQRSKFELSKIYSKIGMYELLTNTDALDRAE